MIEHSTSIRRFERVSGHVIVAACVATVVAMTAFICVTANLLD